jgi:hypothetical protein
MMGACLFVPGAIRPVEAVGVVTELDDVAYFEAGHRNGVAPHIIVVRTDPAHDLRGSSGSCALQGTFAQGPAFSIAHLASQVVFGELRNCISKYTHCSILEGVDVLSKWVLF